ncbi:MAG: 50S ribosomal protein L23 [Myxococcales bacterium]|nr:50S ribosomal protein L23 [Myxococcales bacterium]
MNPEQIIKRPIALTEKAADLKGENKITFEVAMHANKIEIKSAIESLFDVKVADVNTQVYRGKPKKIGRMEAKRVNWKKAIVTLRPGSSIEFFDESKE